jgi:hypothetical protein
VESGREGEGEGEGETERREREGARERERERGDRESARVSACVREAVAPLQTCIYVSSLVFMSPSFNTIQQDMP